MKTRDIQQLLAKAGHYRGAIDGDAGPLTMAAVEAARVAGGHGPWTGWNKARRLIGAGQAVLALLGHEPGAIDGWAGHNTAEALTAFLTQQATGVVPLWRPDAAGAGATGSAATAWPLQKDMTAFYGPAGGPQCTAGSVVLPIPFTIAWNTVQKVARFSCHMKVAGAMTGIFTEAFRHYGEQAFRKLRLDMFGGCFNHRNMRGGTALSTHAFGAATDLDPERNQLRWGKDRAVFARPDYNAFWDIVEAHGAVSLGRVANFDWMHFQFART